MITAGTKVKVGTEQLDYGDGEILEFKCIGIISGSQQNIYTVKLSDERIIHVSEFLITIKN